MHTRVRDNDNSVHAYKRYWWKISTANALNNILHSTTNLGLKSEDSITSFHNSSVHGKFRSHLTTHDVEMNWIRSAVHIIRGMVEGCQNSENILIMWRHHKLRVIVLNKLQWKRATQYVSAFPTPRVSTTLKPTIFGITSCSLEKIVDIFLR